MMIDTICACFCVLSSKYGATALIIASMNGFVEMVELLLSYHNVDVNIVDKVR